MLLRVMIVEDELVTALDLEQALRTAGCEVCGVAASETHALALAKATRPEFAVLDINLAPGDGRVVARELIDRYCTAVLFASAYHGDVGDLAMTGAHGFLPKPYDPEQVHPSLLAVAEIRAGRIPDVLPGGFVSLRGRS